MTPSRTQSRAGRATNFERSLAGCCATAGTLNEIAIKTAAIGKPRRSRRHFNIPAVNLIIFLAVSLCGFATLRLCEIHVHAKTQSSTGKATLHQSIPCSAQAGPSLVPGLVQPHRLESRSLQAHLDPEPPGRAL